ncbi:MAG: carboxymuconolactone decarboxylase family protein [Vitreoscilla sp.]
MAHVQHLAPGPTELDQTWGVRPGFYAIFMADFNASIARVDPVLIEVCRLRMALLLASEFDLGLRYQPAARAGLTEAKIAALPQYLKSPLYSQTERLCIEFAEIFVIQSSNISDEDVARVQAALGSEQFIYFVKALSVMDQFQRGTVAFGVRPGKQVPATLPEFRLLEAETA